MKSFEDRLKEKISTRKQNALPYELAISVFEYKDGFVFRRKTGRKCGGFHKATGYYDVTYKRNNYRGHRLIWLLCKGYWPTMLDHIDGNKANNFIENLREVTARENSANKVEHRNGKTLGAGKTGLKKSWSTRIWVNGKDTYLGSFPSEKEANACYVENVRRVKNGLPLKKSKYTRKQLLKMYQINQLEAERGAE